VNEKNALTVRRVTFGQLANISLPTAGDISPAAAASPTVNFEGSQPDENIGTGGVMPVDI